MVRTRCLILAFWNLRMGKSLKIETILDLLALKEGLELQKVNTYEIAKQL